MSNFKFIAEQKVHLAYSGGHLEVEILSRYGIPGKENSYSVIIKEYGRYWETEVKESELTAIEEK